LVVAVLSWANETDKLKAQTNAVAITRGLNILVLLWFNCEIDVVTLLHLIVVYLARNPIPANFLNNKATTTKAFSTNQKKNQSPTKHKYKIK
jgi:hypothetical protein